LNVNCEIEKMEREKKKCKRERVWMGTERQRGTDSVSFLTRASFHAPAGRPCTPAPKGNTYTKVKDRRAFRG
jgi:hypothetical protein